MADDVTERGIALFAEIMGGPAAAHLRSAIDADGFGAAIARLAADHAFAGVWARAGLARAQRSLVTIGVLIAQRQTDELRNHIRIAIANGLTVGEIEEALIQTLPYVGFPAVASATGAIVETLREMGINPDKRTA